MTTIVKDNKDTNEKTGYQEYCRQGQPERILECAIGYVPENEIRYQTVNELPDTVAANWTLVVCQFALQFGTIAIRDHGPTSRSIRLGQYVESFLVFYLRYQFCTLRGQT